MIDYCWYGTKRDILVNSGTIFLGTPCTVKGNARISIARVVCSHGPMFYLSETAYFD
jgi:hypothetical protein